MTLFIETQILKEVVKTDGLRLSVIKNPMSNRILVEFSAEDGKLRLQKSFQDTFEGRKASEEFEKKIKSMKDLKKYFGLNKRSKNVTSKGT